MTVSRRQVLKVFAVSALAIPVANVGRRLQGVRSRYDLKQFWPFPDKEFVYQHYTNGQPIAEKIESIRHERWADGAHFTIHHWGTTWCPRTDDVMVWDGDLLYYTDTYNFYKNEHTQLRPGHVWAERWMEGNADAKASTVTHEAYRITHVNCGAMTSGTRISSSTDEVWRRLVEDETAWSPFTGGITNPVPVVRLDQTTCINANPHDYFEEKWYFYQHAALGWIAIHSTGYRSADVNERWEARLLEVLDW